MYIPAFNGQDPDTLSYQAWLCLDDEVKQDADFESFKLGYLMGLAAVIKTP